MQAELIYAKRTTYFIDRYKELSLKYHPGLKHDN